MEGTTSNIEVINDTVDASTLLCGKTTISSSGIITSTTINPINTISISGKSYSLADTVARLQIDEIVERIEKMLKAPKMKSISCMHCGAPLEMKFDDHIVKCSYCHSAYAIDTDMIRDIRNE